MRFDKAVYIVHAHKTDWNILHAGAGSSSKLGYFPDKSIEKAVGIPFDRGPPLW
jgi:hypothetical protein